MSSSLRAFREHVHHPDDHQRGFLGDRHLRGEIPGVDEVVHDFVALAEFFDGLGNPVERLGQRLDVLAVEGGDEDLDEFLG